MPVILPKDCISEWVDPGENPEEMKNRFLSEMIWEKAV